MIKIHRSLSEVPDYDSDSPSQIWRAATEPGLAELAIVNMFSELGQDVGSLTDNQCRTALSRIQGYYNMAFSKERLETKKRGQDDLEPIIDDPEFEH